MSPLGKRRWVLVLFGALMMAAGTAILRAGTLVRFRTTLGDVVVELYDREKPLTTSNFLRYVRAGRYTNMFAHRIVPGFVIQGGGFRVAHRGTASNTVESVAEFPCVSNEFDVGPRYRNLYGTLSMAKKGASTNLLPTVRVTNAAVAFTRFAGLRTNAITYTNAFPEVATVEVYTDRIVATNGTGPTQVWVVSTDGVVYSGGPHSASSQWFLSFGDNSANLDEQNGGFTVFGRVVGDTNTFNRLNTFQPIRRATNVVFPAEPPFNELPLLQYFEPLSLAQLFAGLLFVDITELPSPGAPVPDPGLPGVRLAGPLELPHSVEAAAALQGPWLTLSNFTGRASSAQVPDPEGLGPLRLYRLKVPFSLPRPE
jgi:cyclophilin family peptidyl-prolyl cis-trans isomerase